MNKWVKLNDNYLLYSISREIYDKVKEITGSIIFNCPELKFNRAGVVDMFNGSLHKLNYDHQIRCVKILGKGEAFEMLTSHRKPFESIPRNWKRYNNYNGERPFAAVADALDKGNGLEIDYKGAAVKSMISAIKAIDASYSLVIAIKSVQFK